MNAPTVTGLTEDVSAILEAALVSVERSLGPLLSSRLLQAHEEVIARCMEDEADTQILIDMLAEQEEAEDDR